MRASGWVCLLGLVGGVVACGTGATNTSDAGADVTQGDSAMDGAVGLDGEAGTMSEGGSETSAQCPDMDDDQHPALSCGGDDCDDNDRRRYPGAREVCDGEGRDEDCNPCTVGEVTPGGVGGDSDQDEDGYPSNTCFNVITGAAMPVCAASSAPDAGSEPAARVRVDVAMRETRGADCNDRTRSRNPAASEVCDADMLDENCDGRQNEGCTCRTGMSRYCADRTTEVRLRGVCGDAMQDCIDGVWGLCPISPVEETCNMRDDDCDGETDEGLRTDCYRDADGDGFAAAGATVSRECGIMMDGALQCPAGFTSAAPAGDTTDCDDMNSARSPRISEIPCNRVDDDCRAATSDSTCPLPGQSCATGGCTCPAGQVLCGGTCRSLNASCSEGVGVCRSMGTEICDATGTVVCSAVAGPANPVEIPCNAADDDCDGMVDELACPGAQICNIALRRCECEGGLVSCGPAGCQVEPTCAVGLGRCRTTVPQVCMGLGFECPTNHAGDTTQRRAEECNGVDDDCDGMVDEGFVTTCWTDQDSDGYAATGAASSLQCDPVRSTVPMVCPARTTARAPVEPDVDCFDDVAMSGASFNPRNTTAVQCNRDLDCDGQNFENVSCRPANVACTGANCASVPQMEPCMDPACGNAVGTRDCQTDCTFPTACRRTGYQCVAGSSTTVGCTRTTTVGRIPVGQSSISCMGSNPCSATCVYQGCAYAPESACNFTDDNCDGRVDEGLGTACDYTWTSSDTTRPFTGDFVVGGTATASTAIALLNGTYNQSGIAYANRAMMLPTVWEVRVSIDISAAPPIGYPVTHPPYGAGVSFFLVESLPIPTATGTTGARLGVPLARGLAFQIDITGSRFRIVRMDTAANTWRVLASTPLEVLNISGPQYYRFGGSGNTFYFTNDHTIPSRAFSISGTDPTHASSFGTPMYWGVGASSTASATLVATMTTLRVTRSGFAGSSGTCDPAVFCRR